MSSRACEGSATCRHPTGYGSFVVPPQDDNGPIPGTCHPELAKDPRLVGIPRDTDPSSFLLRMTTGPYQVNVILSLRSIRDLSASHGIRILRRSSSG